MDASAFKLLHGLESSWWYRGRAAVVENILSRGDLPKNARILDFGAGFGGMQQTLARYGSVSAFEPEALALDAAQKRGYTRVYESADEALRGGPYDLIALFDVLEHIEDDAAFLKKAHAALSPQGRIVITVPAMPFLWSEHDVTHHHYRRYTSKTLRTLLEETGHGVTHLSYWNMILFPIAAAVRLLGRTGETSFSIHPFLNSVLLSTIQFEVFLMRLMPLPFGISLAVLAHKK